MDRTTLIEKARLSCEHDWQTSYLIPRCAKCGFTEDGFRYFNQGVAHGFDAALSLFQWRDVADGLPEVSGLYVVKLKIERHAETFFYEKSQADDDYWRSVVEAYIPYPIPPYENQLIDKVCDERDSLRTENARLLLLLADIRSALGDPEGKMMQKDFVEYCKEVVAERDRLRECCYENHSPKESCSKK